MERMLSAIIALLLLAACSDNKQVEELLDRAEAMMGGQINNFYLK